MTENEYKPCLKKPAGYNPYLIRVVSGGVSKCDPGNNSHGQRDPLYDVLPNCVGWALGRFSTVAGKWCGIPGHARDFIRYAKKLGYEISEEPTLGGIMVWSGGKSGLGHVAICEIKYDDGSVVTSESEYNGYVFATYHRRGKNYSDGCYWMGDKYTYLGCIKNPAVEEEEEMTDEKFAEFMNRWLEGQKTKPASAWAEPSLEWAKDEGIMVGDASGNQMPKSFATREEIAAMLQASSKKCGCNSASK